MGNPVNITQDGKTFAIDEGQVPAALAQGFKLEDAQAQSDRVAQEAYEKTYGGVGGQVTAVGAGALRGITFGGSDAAFSALGGADDLRALRDVNPGLSTVGNIGGVAAGALLTGGANLPEAGAAEGATIGGRLLSASPAALTAKIGSKIAAAGEGASLVGRTASTVAGGALEGAAQNAGAYVSDVALGDRKLSADGFVGSMGQGALWGGVASGALALSSEGLTAARRLFPKTEMTAEAVTTARRAATREIETSLDDSAHLANTAESELSNLRAQEEISNPTFRDQVNQIRLKAAQDLADAKIATARAQQSVAEARAVREQAVTESRITKIEEQAARKGRPRGRKPAEPESTSGEPGAAEPTAGEGDPDLLAALRGTKSELDSGVPLRDVNGAGERGALPDTGEFSTGVKGAADGVQHVEDAINAKLAEVNQQAAAIYGPLKAARKSSETMKEWLEKYGGDSAVAYDSANAAVRKQKIADWAKNASPADIDGELAAAHFQGDPENTGRRLGDLHTPEHVRLAANDAAAEAAHRAYLDATAEAANSSSSGTELMARARYASERAAAKASDEVHTTWHATGQLPATKTKTVAATESAAHKSPAASLSEIRPPTGDEIVAAQQPVSTKIDKALSHKHADINDDITKTAELFTQHEAAHADLADALGPSAPASSKARADEFREAQRASASKAAQQTADLASAVATAPRGVGHTLLDHAKDAGSAYEALRMMGVPLPDPHNVPVIGPLLSVYLKSKVISKAFGRFGGQVAATSETTIAAKSAALRERTYAVVDSMLGIGAKVTKVAAVSSGGVAAALGHVLFAHDEPKTPYSSKPQGGELGELYAKRAGEVNAAMQPGAIEASFRKKIQTSDPEVLQQIIEAQTRKLQVISDAMPKPATPPMPLEHRAWLPAKQDLTQWAKIIQAVDDPAGTFERAASGNASADEIKAVAKVYPSLYADAQQRVMTKLSDSKIALPFAQRQNLSRTWGLPLDSSVQPDHAAFLQAGYQAQPAAPQPAAPMGQPTLAGPIGLGARMMTRL